MQSPVLGVQPRFRRCVLRPGPGAACSDPAELAQSFVEDDRGGVGKVETSHSRSRHRDTEGRREDFAEIIGEASALAAEDESVFVPEFDGGVGGSFVRAECEATGIGPDANELRPTPMDVQIHQRPVVEASATKVAIFE